MKTVSLTITFVLAFLCFQLKAQTILYVDQSVATSGNGLSWATAYKDLYEAEYYSWQNLSVKEIRIAEGSYNPHYTGFQYSNINLQGSPITSSGATGKFTFRNGLKIEGGFSAGGGVQDITTHFTILNGGGPPNLGTTAVCAIGAAPFYDVATSTYVSWRKSDSTSINGLILINANKYIYGSGETNGLQVPGGDSAKLLIKNCQFVNNGIGLKYLNGAP